MEKSNYNIIINDKIVNTKSGSEIILNKEYLDAFIASKWCFFCSNELEILLQNGFLVDSRNDEKMEILTAINNKKKSEMRVIIFPTMQCNFRCTYCYEKKDNINLSNSNYDKILELIKQFDGNVLLISWFGGEPTLRMDEIMFFLQKVNCICKIKKIKFISTMTTNFFYLDLKKLSELIDLGVTDYQVTLDGLAKVHNKYRPLINGNGSFDVVFNNLKNALNSKLKFKITIRLNYDNATDYNDFYKMLIPFSKDERFSFEINPICNWDLKKRDYTCNEFEIHKREKEIEQILRKYNFRYTKKNALLKFGPCYACLKNNFVVDASGNIKKCTVHLEDSNNYLGNIVDIKQIDDFKWVKFKFDECPDCELFPICLGKMCKYIKEDSYNDCRNRRVEEYAKCF